MMFLDDYVPGPYSITFTPGQTRQSLLFNIEEDNILESDEVFSFSIDSSSLPNGATTGNFATTNITILDDECKYLIVGVIKHLQHILAISCYMHAHVYKYVYQHTYINKLTETLP